MIRVLLVDDHTVLRQAVRVMLETERDLRVVGESGDGRDAVEQAARLRPDVAIVDLKMPGASGLTAIRALLAASPKTAVIVFTMYNNPVYVSESIRAGAGGYVLKSVSKQELLRAIRAVHGGRGFLQAEVRKPILRRLALDAKLDERSNLTLREIQILESLSEGKTNKEIAQALDISDETVKSHLKNLYEKLGASDRAQAVAIALRQNLIE